MNILFAASEASPFASTGGLAGVASSLPAALEEAGHRVTLVMPLYGCVDTGSELRWWDQGLSTFAGEEFGLAETVHPLGGYRVLFVSRDEYFARPGIYGPDSATAYEDNAARYAFFCRAVVSICDNLQERVDVVHCNDWQCGLVPAYLRNVIRPATVFTIHNLHFQGNYPPGDYPLTHLPWNLFTPEGLEFYGTFSFLKAGIVFADRITTVSETYSREIQTPQYGQGMDGILRARTGRLSGILNGIDNGAWDPLTDPALAAGYSAASITPRRKCRRELAGMMGLDPRKPIAGIVSRLSGQKGLDLLFPAMRRTSGIGFAILGTGEKAIERELALISREKPGTVGLALRYDDTMARRIFAGCDVLLMPSRFEPCGLAQMIGMRYGAVPLVRRTGGLADTVRDVEDGGCGFVFRRPDPAELWKTLKSAVDLYNRRNRWAWLIKRNMLQDNSWRSRITLYEDVYRKAKAHRKAR